MQAYYTFVAKSMKSNKIMWTEPYFDFPTGLSMITASKAIYYTKGNTQFLLGVVAMDLLMSKVIEVEPNYSEIIK